MSSRKLIVTLSIAFIFFAANLYSYYLMPEYPTMDDGFVYFGWPFHIYAEGGFAGVKAIIWTGLIGNIALGLCVNRIAISTLRIPRKLWAGRTSMKSLSQ